MFETTESYVLLNQEISDNSMCNVGVRQGEHMSPVLFACHVNNTEERLNEPGCNYLSRNNGAKYL